MIESSLSPVNPGLPGALGVIDIGEAEPASVADKEPINRVIEPAFDSHYGAVAGIGVGVAARVSK